MTTKNILARLPTICCAAALGTILLVSPANSLAASDIGQAKNLYQQGNFAGAFEIWQKEAQKGDPVAQFNLATLYESGRGVDRDPDLARSLLMKSANSNYAPALHNLALLQIEENKPQQALEHLQKAADQNFTASLYTLGKFYQLGISGEAEPKLAFQYIDQAAEAGHIQAQYNLGKMYRDGFGVEASEEISFNWFLRAAKQGSQKAQAKLAQRYANGVGVQNDPATALKWALISGENTSKETFDLKDHLLKNLSVEEIEQAITDATAFRAKKEQAIN